MVCSGVAKVKVKKATTLSEGAKGEVEESLAELNGEEICLSIADTKL